MTRTIDPSFSTRPVPTWMTGAQSSLVCSAVNGPDDPENGDGIDGGPLEPKPEPAMAGMAKVSSFAEFSPNIHPIPASGTIPRAKMVFWSQEGTTTEFTGNSCTIYDLDQFSRDPQTGLRRAVKVSTKILPFEISTMLLAAGQQEYVLQHIDDITFCPFLIMTDLDQRNLTHLPSAAIYAQDSSERARKLYINVHKQAGTDPNGNLVLDARADFEILPDIIDGAVRLHIMTNVMNVDEPADHLELSYIRRMSIPLQISAIDVITGIYERDGATTELPYIYLKKLRQELIEELKHLEQ